MRRETQNVLLVLLGGALLKIALNGQYLRYVKPSFLPFLIAAAVVMLGLAFVAIAQDIIRMRHKDKPVPVPVPVCAEGAEPAAADHDHGHDHGKSRSPWFLLLPVLTIFLIAPPALGAASVNPNDTRTVTEPAKRNGSANFEPLPAGPVIPMKMTDFLTRVVWDDSGTLNGREVRLTGFMYRDKGVSYLTRMVIGCCAADAQPMKVRLDGPRAGEVKEIPMDSWLELTGKVQPGTATEANAYTPAFDVSEIKPIPAPAEQYES
ncbi:MULTISPECIES: TIGR03943 family protein [unclassified Crossiella]|uniref:TIGR03943 family putative permease subunit n=1 Tax=unclassified Crossiella TaxID=2620835 RepID=UPI001FFFE5B5|nr:MULTISPECIES: TIGR03943 family protein [unclassified Crossiella]MCK2241038.1 TIGR03943 family protein [Crossiella sp. S99.2]MCK2253818.1 TIGR03943 family protein [Crossiella sp. S99.1]